MVFDDTLEVVTESSEHVKETFGVFLYKLCAEWDLVINFTATWTTPQDL